VPSFWLFEFEVLCLIAFVVGVYATTLTDLPIRGEESRRAQIAREMQQTGDWIVPRQQGEPFLSRPPLGNWLIALTILARGDCDVIAVRLPSVLATLLTTLLIYAYGRTFLPRLGALASAIVYATMVQVMELGGLAETEAVFTFLLSASLLVWHWGYARRWPAAWSWVGAYGLAALATLTKGPQAPLYFAAAVGLYLLMKDWRYLITWSHLLGILVFVGIIGVWQVPFYRELGWSGVRQVWAGDTALRFLILDAAFVSKHVLTYPFEIFCCTLPWSPLLGFYLSRTFRRALGIASGRIQFLALSLAVTFPSCWLVPGAQSRYFMPLYPLMALLAGLVIQRCVEADAASPLRWAWRCLLAFLAPTPAFGGLVLAMAALFHVPRLAALPPLSPTTWLIVFMAGALAILVWSVRNRCDAARGKLLVLGVGALLGLLYVGIFVPYIGRKSEDAAPAVARLKEQLPPQPQLVSFGPVSHLFTYLYREPIRMVPWPVKADDLDSEPVYFCFEQLGKGHASIPFAWEEVAVISCDRYRTPIPQCEVVIGRRVPAGSFHREPAASANLNAPTGSSPARSQAGITSH
jgi:4-amino-4-deoxy-L-arabinose transferase-like glycosyltransferase